MSKILVLGGTGYVGSRLVPVLAERGHKVRCLVRDSRKAYSWSSLPVEVFAGDVMRPESLGEALRDVEVVVYLIHSMRSGADNFEEMDRKAAENVAEAAKRAGVRRIIYLGGLGRKGWAQSPHLRSRHEVANALGCTGIAVTEFRAAVIVGAGSLSFEMIHHLVNRLPAMICPRWVTTRTQPIAVDDAIRYLTDSIELPATVGRVIDIGGSDVLTFRDMMLTVARVLGLRRLLLQVPVLTPRLSSYWVNLVTPIHSSVARSLIESLRFETICENDDARRLFSFAPMTFEAAVTQALQAVKKGDKTVNGTAAYRSGRYAVDQSHLLSDQQTVKVNAPAQFVFAEIAGIGGKNGWYHADWLWTIRGFLDRLVGGAGLQRTTRDNSVPKPGDSIDFWRVEDCELGRRLLLRAEMKIWGKAWLEFAVEEINGDRARLRQTAWYYPRGLAGILYWYLSFPVHVFVFWGLARAIGRRAERKMQIIKKAQQT